MKKTIFNSYSFGYQRTHLLTKKALFKKEYIKAFFLYSKLYFYPLTELLKKIKDRFWFKYILKNDEFNKKLDFDTDAYSKMTDAEKTTYSMELIRKRNLAHNLDLEKGK
jgi:hypothetical protein